LWTWDERKGGLVRGEKTSLLEALGRDGDVNVALDKSSKRL